MAARRAVAIALVLLVLPSAAWLVLDPGGDRWTTELVFVACCLLAAGAAWAAVRYWQLVILAVAAVYTYVITGPLVSGILLIAPWSYISSVAKEAGRRGFADGAWLIWSLLVLPAAFPVICFVMAWLCLAGRQHQNASAI